LLSDGIHGLQELEVNKTQVCYFLFFQPLFANLQSGKEYFWQKSRRVNHREAAFEDVRRCCGWNVLLERGVEMFELFVVVEFWNYF
jgi:hypothetical protein